VTRPLGQKRATAADVAHRAGVSRQLVSLVIRDQPGPSAATRERVLQAAAELGYQRDTRAAVLRSTRSYLLGVMFGVQNTFHADLVEGIYAAAEAAGYDVLLSALTPSRDEPRALETLLADRCEALILLGPEAPVARLTDLSRRLPVVVLARKVRDAPVDVVRTADERGIRQAIDHLVEHGHRDIAHVDGGHAPSATERRRGYRAAMRRHGFAERVRILPGGLTEETGDAAARTLLADDALPTAVIAFNDRCAVGLLDTLIRAGVDVPGDVSVVGYDDDHLSRLAHVNLTTVGQDAHRMAALAVERAISRVENPEQDRADREIVLAPNLIVRGSTAAARSAPLKAGGDPLDIDSPLGARD
jgi:DNA-binding LacI/PurR family transcriptional regulator